MGVSASSPPLKSRLPSTSIGQEVVLKLMTPLIPNQRVDIIRQGRRGMVGKFTEYIHSAYACYVREALLYTSFVLQFFTDLSLFFQ